ncbi:MAG: hypothetical protein HYZ57_08970 [Acidobacteria bacterium]|nr:hypothetical protein [Acidobacteriota bacterium]
MSCSGRSRTCELFGSIENLLGSVDRKLRDAKPAFDRPDYGRAYRAGLRYQFGRGT